MDGTVHIVTLEQKPCVVHYLEHYNKFLVGTYELFPSIEDARLKLNSHLDDHQLKKTLDSINNRAGKLILLRGNDVSVPCIEYEFDCQQGGGVFDAKVRYNKLDASYNIYVAHSNGSVGIYKLALHCGNKVCLKEHIKVQNSKMLTSIDIFPDTNCNSKLEVHHPHHQPACSNHSPPLATNGGDSLQVNQVLSSSASSSSSSSLNSTNSAATRLVDLSHSPLSNGLVVGDMDGQVTIVTKEGFVSANVGQGDSIWQVKCLRLASGRQVIIVCAENSSWSIYGHDERAKRLILLYKNEFKDFGAGVTSIHILNIVRSLEYDLVELMLGSYDETLQTYHVKINHDGTSKPDVCHKNTITIENGGIWRVKPFRGSNKKQQLCIAAMYAGSYILTLDGVGQETLAKLIDADTLKLANKPLHYDIDVSACNTTYCIVDFNNSLCIFKTLEH